MTPRDELTVGGFSQAVDEAPPAVRVKAPVKRKPAKAKAAGARRKAPARKAPAKKTVKRKG